MVAIHVAVVLLQEVLDVISVVHLRLCALAVGARPMLALLDSSLAALSASSSSHCFLSCSLALQLCKGNTS